MNHWFKLISLALTQAALLAGGQVLMKVALAHMEKAAMTWHFICHSLLLNGWWALCGVSFTAAGILWMYLLKHYPFSVVYPLSAVAYVFGMIAAMLVFKEHISLAQWLGILLIMAGCALTTTN